MSDVEPIPAPPTGEEIHMPEPSLVPILNAAGLAVAIVGVTTSHVLTILGGALFLVTLIRWIRDAMHELDELPAEHH